MKKCAICKQDKDLNCFAMNKQSSTGRGAYCKPCHQEYKKRLRATKKGKEMHRDRNKINARKLLNSNRCRSKTYSLMRKGTLTKSSSCDKCGCTDKLEIHHYDYNLHYYVSTLCKPCHVDWHSKNEPRNKSNGIWTTGVDAYFTEDSP